MAMALWSLIVWLVVLLRGVLGLRRVRAISFCGNGKSYGKETDTKMMEWAKNNSATPPEVIRERSDISEGRRADKKK